jgi:pantothenate synthetase
VLSRALAVGRSLLEEGVDFSSTVAEAMRRVVAEEPLVHLDYAVAVGAHDLVAREVTPDPAAVRLLIAADVGPVRLIDNCAGAVEAPAPSTSRAVEGGRAHATIPVDGRQLERIG